MKRAGLFFFFSMCLIRLMMVLACFGNVGRWDLLTLGSSSIWKVFLVYSIMMCFFGTVRGSFGTHHGPRSWSSGSIVPQLSRHSDRGTIAHLDYPSLQTQTADLGFG